jgi:hypothetical protein
MSIRSTAAVAFRVNSSTMPSSICVRYALPLRAHPSRSRHMTLLPKADVRSCRAIPTIGSGLAATEPALRRDPTDPNVITEKDTGRV